jgi:hypothetical protein
VDALMLRPFSPLNPRRRGLCVGVALQASFSAFRMLAGGAPSRVAYPTVKAIALMCPGRTGHDLRNR